MFRLPGKAGICFRQASRVAKEAVSGLFHPRRRIPRGLQACQGGGVVSRPRYIPPLYIPRYTSALPAVMPATTLPTAVNRVSHAKRSCHRTDIVGFPSYRRCFPEELLISAQIARVGGKVLLNTVRVARSCSCVLRPTSVRTGLYLRHIWHVQD